MRSLRSLRLSRCPALGQPIPSRHQTTDIVAYPARRRLRGEPLTQIFFCFRRNFYYFSSPIPPNERRSRGVPQSIAVHLQPFNGGSTVSTTHVVGAALSHVSSHALLCPHERGLQLQRRYTRRPDRPVRFYCATAYRRAFAPPPCDNHHHYVQCHQGACRATHGQPRRQPEPPSILNFHSGLGEANHCDHKPQSPAQPVFPCLVRRASKTRKSRQRPVSLERGDLLLPAGIFHSVAKPPASPQRHL